jgi:hypothetical protein
MMLHCGRQRRKPSNLQATGEAAIDDRGRRGPSIWPLSIEWRCCPGTYGERCQKPTTEITDSEINLLDRVSEITLAGDRALSENRWILVDAQLDAVQRETFKPGFDPLDVPRDGFIVAGDAWRQCRTVKQIPTSSASRL